MKSIYELKQFKNSNDPDLSKALVLYSNNMEAAYRTDSREIMYWIDRFNKKFEDSFFVLGFYLNDSLIGFSELAFFMEEKTVIIDYLVVDQLFRGNNTFYEFIHKIQEFLNERGIFFDYAVVEIGYFNEKLEPPAKSKYMIRLLKMAGFGVVKCTYYTPRLGVHNFESEMKSVLMIYSNSELKQIKKETFFQIVNAIYFKYNQRWYEAFLNDGEKLDYQRELHKLLDKIERDLKSHDYIEINGYINLFTRTAGRQTKLSQKRIVKLITGLILFVGCFVFSSAVYLILKSKFGIDASALSPIFYTSLFLLMFLFTLLFEKKANIFSKIIEKIFELW